MGTGQHHYLMDMEGMSSTQLDSHLRMGCPEHPAEDGTIWSGGLDPGLGRQRPVGFRTPRRDAGIPCAPMHHDWQRMWNKKLNQWTHADRLQPSDNPGRGRGRGGGIPASR